MASEYRQITRYEDIPPIVRGAILAAEDKNFFSHSGVDYSGFVRVVWKLRMRDLMGRLTHMGRRVAVNSAGILPQGGSTITQQLVRGYFLKTMTAQENSDQLRPSQTFSAKTEPILRLWWSRTTPRCLRLPPWLKHPKT